MSGVYDGWLHSLSQDGAYPFLLERKGNVKLFRVREPYTVTYHVWNGDRNVYVGTNNAISYKVFRKESKEEAEEV